MNVVNGFNHCYLIFNLIAFVFSYSGQWLKCSPFSVLMGSNASTLPEKESEVVATVTSTSTESKPKKKICCACPDTKKLRDECIVEHGEAACSKYIEAHLECLRAEGFKI